MLTNAVAKAAGAKTRAYKIHDQGGMHLLVRPTGTKSWQQKYRWKGREKLLTIGQYPDVSIAQARILQEEAKDAIARHVDPARIKSSAPTGETFGDIARDWHRHNLPHWSTAHAVDVLGQLKVDVFPQIENSAIGEIDAAQLLDIVRSVEQRGAVEAAGRLRQRLSAIFQYAIALSKTDTDPAAQLGRAMAAKGVSVPHPALTDLDDCRRLIADCEDLRAAPDTLAASRFLALTAVRLDCALGARWDEVEGLDGDAPIWRVPAARMKLSRAKKGDNRYDHIVPLARPAVALLRDVAVKSAQPVKAGLIFTGRGGVAPIAPGTLRDLYIRAGYQGRHVPHGWRASFSTILNEQLGEEWRFAIDSALAHSAKGKVEAAYNRSQQLDRRRQVFDRWGELLSP
ncbi:MAG: integrase arm-type DNA-binding domain-containing protein [Pontixanthobacter sp.]